MQKAPFDEDDGADVDLRLQPNVSLRVLATEKLRRAISEGAFPPGKRLVERELCAALGVSRTVVREALGQLVAEGYVADLPRRGHAVAPFGRDAVRAIYEVREMVEATAAALFVQRASAEHRDAIRDTIARFIHQEQAGEHVVLLELLNEFVHHVCVGSGNPLLETILKPMTGRTHMLQVRGAKSAARRQAALQEIKALAEALLGEDPQAAYDASRLRLRNAARFALQDLS